MNRRRGSEPLLNNNVLLHGDRGDGAAVDSLLTVAGVAGIGIDDPGLVVSELEHLGAEFAAEPTSNTCICINLWRCHNYYSLLNDFDERTDTILF